MEQKRKILEYKAKKKQTEHLLANAEYIDFEDIANQTPDLECYEEVAPEKSETPGGMNPRRRPPAIQ